MQLRRTFLAPRFADEREDAFASLLNTILWATVAGAVVLQAYQLYAGIDWLRLLAVGASLGLGIVGLTLLRYRKLSAASWLVTSALYVVACASIWLGGGIHAPGAATLVVLVVVSAVGLASLPTAVWAGVSVLTLFLFGIAEQQGLLHAVQPRRPALELGLLYSLHIGAAAWLILRYTGAVRSVLDALGTRSAELTHSEERYAQLIDQSPDVIVAIDLNGVVAECSPAIESLFGYAPADVIGQPFRTLGVIPNEVIGSNLDTFHSLVAGEEPALAEIQVIHRDGTTRWVEANSRLGQLADGTKQLYLVIRDVTARVEAEKRREALEEQLFDARQLEALGRMAGGLAHDFNNLLTVIMGNAELLQTDGEFGNKETLQEIQVAGSTAADLTNQLLAFAGRKVQRENGVDVAASLANIEKLLRRLLPPNCALEISVGPALPLARGDRTQFEQVILNLVMNAQQAMPDGGTVTIEVSDVQVGEQERRVPADASDCDHVRVAVSDTGQGMDEETLRHLFEPFYSGRKNGTGLGLATVYGAIHQSGGHIRVRSRPQEGTRFELLLPHAISPETAEAATEADPIDKRATLLLVDDEPMVLKTAARLLESRGFRVLTAQSLETARAVADGEEGRIDVLVTDVLMPDTTGPQLAKNLVASRPDMQVLLMSGYTEDQLDPSAVASGALHFISKPFSAESLATKIQNVLRTAEDSEPPRAQALGST